MSLRRRTPAHGSAGWGKTKSKRCARDGRYALSERERISEEVVADTLTYCLRVITGTALIVGLANAQEATQIAVSERYMLAPDQIYRRDPPLHSATHVLTLTLVYFTGGDWPRDAMVGVTRSAAEILEQCSVGLSSIELVRVDAPRRFHYLNTPASRELAGTLRLTKPTVYFATDTCQQPAFDAEAIGRSNGKTRLELADSVWVTRATRDPGVALAHELVHVLTDSGGHIELPGNLMREETTPENTRLTGAQCAQLRDVGAKNGLLRIVAK